MKVLLTGAAGFIGRATAEALLKADHQVVAVDNLNDYYAVGLKHARLATLREQPGLQFIHWTWPTGRRWMPCLPNSARMR